MPVGQINLNSNFGQKIRDEAQSCDNIVEIGTWNGCGSTKCVLAGMKEGANFISIEVVEKMYKQAVVHLKGKPVRLLHGTIIEPNDIYWFDMEYFKDCKQVEKDHFRLYYELEIEAIKNAKNVLSEIPSKIDLLILDGGEYSTYPEWRLLKPRTTTVALDDTELLKTKQIQQELESDPEWSTCWLSSERYGCSIHRRNNVRKEN